MRVCRLPHLILPIGLSKLCEGSNFLGVKANTDQKGILFRSSSQAVSGFQIKPQSQSYKNFCNS